MYTTTTTIGRSYGKELTISVRSKEELKNEERLTSWSWVKLVDS